MWANGAPCDRAPLCEVQNEASTLQRRQSVKAHKGTKEQRCGSTSADPNRYGNKENRGPPLERHADGPLPGFPCAGEEVELLNPPVIVRSEEPVLVAAPTSPDAAEALRDAAVTEEREDAPHEAPAADLTFKCFICPGGEVEIADGSPLPDPALETKPSGWESASQSVDEVSEDHLELPRRHSDHPYCRHPTDDPKDQKVADLTFKSFTCPGGEIEISDHWLARDEPTVAHGPEAVPENLLQNLEDSFEGRTELPLQHRDHLYCCSSRTSPDASPSTRTPASTVHAQSVDLLRGDGGSIPNLNLATPSESPEGSALHQDANGSITVDPNASVETDGREFNEKVAKPTTRPLTEGREDAEEGPTTGGPEGENTFIVKSSSVSSPVQTVVREELSNHTTPNVANVSENAARDRLNSQTTSSSNEDELGAEDGHPEKVLGGENAAQGAPENRRESALHPNHVQSQANIWSEVILSEPLSPTGCALDQPWVPESPIPRPQLNSTELNGIASPAGTPRAEARGGGAGTDLSAVGKGPLQQQLRRMAELLMAASGKITATPPVQRHSACVGTSPAVQCHSACVGTSPVVQLQRSVNTSALPEEKKELEVLDACTATDSLLWSVSRTHVECLSRPELEQRLISTLIMVEVLSQQLASAQSQKVRVGAEPNPSGLRDRLVQTERTELSQMGPYKELYVTALDRIRTLEEDQEALHRLHQTMQHTHTSTRTVKAEMVETLCCMKQLESSFTEDQEILSKQKNQVKALHARCMDTLNKMEQKNRVCVKDRNDMRIRMEKALEERVTVLQVLEQLRAHHSAQISVLQHSLGSHEELTASLTHTYPQLVELNQTYVECLTAANTLLQEKLEDHAHLSAELHGAQQLLQKTGPVLQKLQQRASAALKQRARHQEERHRALEDRQQMEKRLDEAHSILQEAEQQIADQNTQMTIMSSEMAVLREELAEVEEDRAQLQRKVTELSATVSSTLVSYAFLEQALASESSKLQRSLHETQEATERADSLQGALQLSEQRVEELEQIVMQKENLLHQLGSETEAQRLQLRRLTQIQSELCNTREMSEFLQVENELTREQLAESEGLLRSHLQGLRERNLECEDLRLELHQLREEREDLQQELAGAREKARLMLLDQGAQLAQATLDTSLLLQRVCALSKNTLATSNHHDKTCDPPAPHPCTSFLTSVIQALTEEQPCVTTAPPTAPVEEEEPTEAIGSRSSAFTRIARNELRDSDEPHGSSSLLELLDSVNESVSQLQAAIEELKLHKDTETENLHQNIRDLREATETESNLHRAETAGFKQQVERLKAQVEKDQQVLHQKAQDEKALRKLCSELEEKMEAAQKQRVENSELRKEGAELRRELLQSQVEVQALRAELNRTAGQSAGRVKDLDDRIRLLREVEKLKASLTEAEDSRAKLLERAKRHQMVHAINQSKLERELHLLDDMIEAVRKALASVPDVVSSCPELQKLEEFLA